ncbi:MULTISPECIES: PGPGW domain-containing protein [Streptomyces]|uniref:PGPGW domain-containing protein n=1 Tax=Streptomyces lienomycini TaxID=284035 RepID=A0ABV9WKN1_9ACTN|nr:PGPGW domain-containing protein [Streptomyces sp. NBC_00334]
MARGVESIRRVALGVVGAVLLVIGVALLVLPGPGLLLVFAGVVLLARAVPALDRFVAPVRVRAMRAAEESVSSRWRIAGSVLVGLFLFAAGLAWGLVSLLPYSGWAAGASLIISSLALFALLGWSHRRVRATRRGSPEAPERTR